MFDQRHFSDEISALNELIRSVAAGEDHMRVRWTQLKPVEHLVYRDVVFA